MTIRTITILCAALTMFFSAFPVNAEVNVSFGVNFSELNDYGEWVHVRGLGRVWRPDAEEGWRPFMYGHWVYSDDGWVWDSDEPFGWIVCHYGNWYNDEEQGWVWVPGYDWSPARVEWYVTDNEIGWAPMFPPGHRHRFEHTQWMYCPIGSFTSDHVYNHVELRFHAARPDVHVRVYAGAPRFDFVKRFTHAPIVRVAPRKVRVADGSHSLFRVEFGNRPKAEVVVHVGPKFRRSGVRVEAQSHQNDVRREEAGPEARRGEPDHRAIVQPKQEDRPEARVRVESRNRRGDNDDNGNGDDNGGHRSRVEPQY